MRDQRRLAAILVADTVGFSRLMERDELGTFEQMRVLRDEVVLPGLQAHGGRLIKTTGDGFLAEFTSANAAVQCAVAIQRTVRERAADVEPDRRIRLRMGLNLGDVIADGDDVAGDGVNIAARLEPLAPPDGICLSAALREQLRDDLGLPLRDLGELQLKNIARPIRACVLSLDTGPEATARFHVSRPVQGFGGKPAIAVLPFENMSNDPEQAYFADGIAEDILTRLAMWRWLPVIGRNSSFAYRGQSADLKAIGRELGARYLLEGSVRRAGDRVRITGQLIDTETGHHVWAQRYDRVLGDIFSLQDEIVEAIVAALEPAVGAAERARVAARTHDLDAWDLCQRAVACVGELTPQSLARAHALGTDAGQRDPGFATPLAFAAMAKVFAAVNGWVQADTAIRECHALASEALRRNPDEPHALSAYATACTLLHFHDAALASARKSVQQNPSYALGRYCLGWTLLLHGQPTEGLREVEVALRLSPSDSWKPTMLATLSSCYLMAGDAEAARDVAAQGIPQSPDYPMLRRSLANACGVLGDFEAGKRELETFLRMAPGYSRAVARQTNPFRSDADFERYMSGLVRLGWAG